MRVLFQNDKVLLARKGKFDRRRCILNPNAIFLYK